jgi:hypothetical protein
VINQLKALFQKEPARSPQVAAADFQKRLQLAKLAKLQMARAAAPKGEFVEPIEVPPMEVKPEMAAPDQSFSCPAYAPIEENALASALERILQGERVPSETFARLYHKGYVFKEKEKQWAITKEGKSLIERHKISDQTQCRINGLPCAKSWASAP